jgi:hypothetical protein
MSSPKTISGQSQNHSGTKGGEVVPLSRISIDTGLRDCSQPSVSKPSRIVLGQTASQALTESGESCFIVAGKQSHPDDPTRWILHLIPCDIATANDANRIINRTHKAVAIRQKAPTPESP